MEPYTKNPRATYTPHKSNDITGSPLRKTSHTRNYTNLRTEPGLTKI